MITYRDGLDSAAGGFTAQQLAESPTRRLQIHQVSDWKGDTLTFNYAESQVGGRWAVNRVDLPGNRQVSYSYQDDHLDTVTFADGSQDRYEYGQDETAQTATVRVTRSRGAAMLYHLTNDYMTLDEDGQAVVINQPVGVFRGAENGDGEMMVLVIPDQDIASQYHLLQGVSRASTVVYGQSQRYFEDGWYLSEPDNPRGLVLSEVAPRTIDGDFERTFSDVAATTTIEDLYKGTIPGHVDATGREFTYEYDSEGFLTKKTFVADSTYEEYAYNEFKQVTRVRDRIGNVTLSEYDAQGNLIKVKTGLKEVNGQDVAQPEYAERSWAYYPVGHINAGFIEAAFDATYDGSSSDLHRTDYEYDARGNVTKIIGPASVAGATRPETLYTYDSSDQVVTTTSPDGHQMTVTTDAKERTIRTTYDDGSTEETLYGIPAGQDTGEQILKTKNRRNVVTTYSYDEAGRTTQVVVGTAWDADEIPQVLCARF